VKEILFDTPHALVAAGGGQRRTLQVADLVKRAGFEVAMLARDGRFPLPRRVRAAVRLMLRYGVSPGRRFSTARYLAREYLQYRAALRPRRGVSLLVWERTRNGGVVAPYAAADAGVRLLAVPQNLESLVEGQHDVTTRSTRPEVNLRDEIQRLRLAAAVFCISYEEQWLLADCGIQAEVLPYFPVAEIEAGLLRLRTRRDPARPARFLVIGTAGNPPVRAGMIELLRQAGPVARRCGCELHVAGYDTEQLAGQLGEATVLHGSVSADELTRLMTTARGALIWQRSGSGALTRIAECLLAGLPVLANEIAARSYHHFPGIHLFRSADELAELMTADLPMPSAPSRPVKDETRFIERLRSLASEP
jgi:hypothetical protein